MEIEVNCTHNNRHCKNIRERPSAMTMEGGGGGRNRPAALNREVTGANRPVRKSLLDFVALKWTTKQSKISEWRCTMFLGWTCRDAASCLAERSRVWPQRLHCRPTLTIKVGVTGFPETSKTQFTARRGGVGGWGDETESINPYKIPIACLRSSWIYWPLKMGRICCPKTSARNYHYTLHNIPQESRYHLRKTELSFLSYCRK